MEYGSKIGTTKTITTSYKKIQFYHYQNKGIWTQMKHFYIMPLLTIWSLWVNLSFQEDSLMWILLSTSCCFVRLSMYSSATLNTWKWPFLTDDQCKEDYPETQSLSIQFLWNITLQQNEHLILIYLGIKSSKKIIFFLKVYHYWISFNVRRIPCWHLSLRIYFLLT